MAATMASPMPVLPLVASIRVSPGLIRPSSSARPDHVEGRAVFDRSPGIIPFEFDENCIAGPY
jgi:hypothetical protein